MSPRRSRVEVRRLRERVNSLRSQGVASGGIAHRLRCSPGYVRWILHSTETPGNKQINKQNNKHLTNTPPKKPAAGGFVALTDYKGPANKQAPPPPKNRQRRASNMGGPPSKHNKSAKRTGSRRRGKGPFTGTFTDIHSIRVRQAVLGLRRPPWLPEGRDLGGWEQWTRTGWMLGGVPVTVVWSRPKDTRRDGLGTLEFRFRLRRRAGEGPQAALGRVEQRVERLRRILGARYGMGLGPWRWSGTVGSRAYGVGHWRALGDPGAQVTAAEARTWAHPVDGRWWVDNSLEDGELEGGTRREVPDQMQRYIDAGEAVGDNYRRVLVALEATRGEGQRTGEALARMAELQGEAARVLRELAERLAARAAPPAPRPPPPSSGVEFG